MQRQEFCLLEVLQSWLLLDVGLLLSKSVMTLSSSGLGLPRMAIPHSSSGSLFCLVLLWGRRLSCTYCRTKVSKPFHLILWGIVTCCETEWEVFEEVWFFWYHLTFLTSKEKLVKSEIYFKLWWHLSWTLKGESSEGVCRWCSLARTSGNEQVKCYRCPWLEEHFLHDCGVLAFVLMVQITRFQIHLFGHWL